MKLRTLMTALVLSMPLAACAQVAIAGPRVQVVRIGGAWMGVGVTDVTEDNMKTLKLKEERGVEVLTVNEGGPASKAGLKEHDVILEYNGTRLEGVEQFKRLISETPIGRAVKLQISRDGAPQTLSLKLEDRSSNNEILRRYSDRDGWSITVPEPPSPPMAPPATPRAPRAPRAVVPWVGSMDDLPKVFDGWPFAVGSPRLGIEGEEVGSQLAEYFGVTDKGGVLVREVSAGSAAEKAGMKAGDVIIKVDGKRVQDMSDVREQIRDNVGKSFPVVVIRNKKEVTLTVKIEKSETGRSSDHV